MVFICHTVTNKRMWKSGYYSTSVSSSVFEIGCVSQVKTRFKQPFVVLSVTFPNRGIL